MLLTPTVSAYCYKIVNEAAVDRLPEIAADVIPIGSRVPRVGGTIRRLRLAKSMTLQGLADASGVSVGMLSQIERDRANPSLRVLSQVRDALGASISALFEESDAPPADPAFVCRVTARPQLELGYLHKELLSRRRAGGLQLMILHVPPHGTSGDQTFTAPFEKGGLVMEGSLVLTVGDELALLHEGDSFLFDGVVAHSFRNPADEPARVLWIVGAPSVEPPL